MLYEVITEKGAGSTTLNMDLVNHAPQSELPFILVTGATFTNCTNEGFPQKDEKIRSHNARDGD